MKFFYHIVFLLIYLTTSDSILYKKSKDNVLAHMKYPVDINKKILRASVDLETDDYGRLDKNPIVKAFTHLENPNANKIKKNSLRTEYDLDEDDYKDGRLAIPSVQNDSDEESKERNNKKTTKQQLTRLNAKSKFISSREESDEKGKVTKSFKPKFFFKNQDNEEKVKVTKKSESKFFYEKEDKENSDVDHEIINYNKRQHMEDVKDAQNAKHKAEVFKKSKKYEARLNNLNMLKSFKSEIGKERYHMDPVLNVLRSNNNFRRGGLSDSLDSSDSSSSSREMKNWKDEFKEHWQQKRWEAYNQSKTHFGDEVNMAAARPWGVPCGDPNQHDMPWGTCMLAIECESEYRIYRGDFFCGRTQFVCCSLQLTTYDLYQGLDASFDDKSLSTESDEKNQSSRENKKKKSRKRKKKRKRDRKKRKDKIKRNIRKIIKEIRKILNKHYRNGTKQRKAKTKQLKKFVKQMKKRYKKEREAIKDLHEEEIIRIDIALMKRLNQIRELNQNFMKNSTFRDIIVNGTATRQGARMLVEAYPELQPYLPTRRSGASGFALTEPKDYLEYDIEYGYLYY